MIPVQPAQTSITMIGGDRRQEYMAELLCQHGYPVSVFGIAPPHLHKSLHICNNLKTAISGSDWILCPIPFHKNLGADIKEILSLMTSKQTLAGGCLSEDILGFCQNRSISFYDFMKSESVAMFNTIATAEGAIAEALLHHPLNLHGAKAIVLGYGRCGKTLAQKLNGLSAQVTVCCRSNDDLAMADALGHHPLSWSKLFDQIHQFQYIFNTIPAMVIDAKLIHNVHPDAIIIDIASAPGGVDFDAAKLAGIHAGLYPGLPGIYAPLSSAKALVTDLIAHF